jgi:hypothetical protein
LEHHYKAHSILISTWARLYPDGFTAELRISKKAHVILHTFKINQIFSSREEAEGYGLQAAKRWIDENLTQAFKLHASVA